MQLRTARLKARLTQFELAERSGVAQNVISQIETGNDFVIISSIELQPSDKQGNASNSADQSAPQAGEFDQDGISGFPQRQPNPSQPRRQSGRTLGQIVSLRMEMAAYYKRPMMEAPATVPAQ